MHEQLYFQTSNLLPGIYHCQVNQNQNVPKYSNARDLCMIFILWCYWYSCC